MLRSLSHKIRACGLAGYSVTHHGVAWNLGAVGSFFEEQNAGPSSPPQLFCWEWTSLCRIGNTCSVLNNTLEDMAAVGSTWSLGSKVVIPLKWKDA